jgi:Transposase DDE domain
MGSISQEHLIPQVEQAIRHLFEAADPLASATGLIKRQGKVTGENLARTLVLGWMSDPDASLETLTQHAAEAGLQITAQGLDKRFTSETATFLKGLFEVALTQVVAADPVAVPLLRRFAAVCLEDSSTIKLPEAFKDVFRGCGGKGSQASCKLFVRLDMLRGQLTCSPLQEGRCADTATPLQAVATPKRTLHVRDRGFVDGARWKEEAEQDEYELSYYRGDLHLFDEGGAPLDLLQLLPQAQATGELRVLVGEKYRLPMRLLYDQVSEEVKQERLRRLRREAKTRGQRLSARTEALAGWTLAVTTVASNLLSLPEALVLLRLRWQMELLFKLWKEQGLVDEWRTENPHRILCEIYAKLIGLLIQHWVLIISCWKEPHRSLVKAAKAVRRRAVLLSAALDGDLSLSVAISRIQRVAQSGSRLNPRQDAPNTSQMLITGVSQWSSKPLRKRRLK